MKNLLNIIIGLLLMANMVFAVGLYNYFIEGENKTLDQIKTHFFTDKVNKINYENFR